MVIAQKFKVVFDSKNNFQSLGRENLDKIIRQKKGEKLKLQGEKAKIQDGVSKLLKGNVWNGD